MKEFFSLLTVGGTAICFVVFFATLKPAAVTAVVGTEKPGHCSTGAAPALACGPGLLAAAWWPDARRR